MQLSSDPFLQVVDSPGNRCGARTRACRVRALDKVWGGRPRPRRTPWSDLFPLETFPPGTFPSLLPAAPPLLGALGAEVLA